MKSEVNKLDIGKLETTPADLGQPSNVVKNYVAKNTKYHELVKNVNAIRTTDTSHLVKKKLIFTRGFTLKRVRDMIRTYS